ncbi:ribbon-helix-helix domain-containing protein [Thioclava sp. GXIMD4216]|uniref:ribbon-helix-helix domain-containing protein n=1 Tax=Thioclava sp. GXIMD4216 TaxID=3131929 RepID=UPI0030D0422F
MCKLFVGARSDLWESQTRSIRMEGMVTSVRLEKAFWMVLEEIAERDSMNVPQLLHQLYNESLDEGHDIGNFTSFLRVCCLRYIDLRLHGLVQQTIEGSTLPVEEVLDREGEIHARRMARSLDRGLDRGLARRGGADRAH